MVSSSYCPWFISSPWKVRHSARRRMGLNDHPPRTGVTLYQNWNDTSSIQFMSPFDVIDLSDFLKTLCSNARFLWPHQRKVEWNYLAIMREILYESASTFKEIPILTEFQSALFEPNLFWRSTGELKVVWLDFQWCNLAKQTKIDRRTWKMENVVNWMLGQKVITTKQEQFRYTILSTNQ
jgi:hypothetical protein